MSERMAVRAPAAKSAAFATTPTKAARPAITPVRTPLLQRACACGQVPGGKCAECAAKDKEKEKTTALHRAPTTGATPSHIPPVVNQALDAPGHGLDAPTRSFMESRFGHDFSGVRVHDDALAAASARAVDARAYTVGNDIVFDRGEYQPQSSRGRWLLAHELAHTMQQADVPQRRARLAIDPAGSHTEHEANLLADRVIAGGPVPGVDRGTLPALQRFAKLSCEHILSAPSDLRVSGIAAHKAITDDFKAQVKDRALGFVIPGASSAPLRTEGCEEETETEIAPEEIGGRPDVRVTGGKPDLMYNTGKYVELAEIKIGVPTCLPLAEQQVARYIEQGNAPDNFKWRRSKGLGPFKPMATSRFTPRSPITVDGKQVSVAWCREAVIIYRAFDPADPALQKLIIGETEAYELKAGTVAVTLQVPKATGKKAEPIDLAAIAENATAVKSLPGLVLTTLTRRPAATDVIDASVDTSEGSGATSTLPIKIPKGQNKIRLLVNKQTRAVSLQNTKAHIPFEYGPLSPGAITEIGVDDTGEISWKGTIKPSIPFIGELGLEYSKGTLLIVKGLKEEELKKKSLLGMKITKAQLQLQLAPEFTVMPNAVIEAQFGSDDSPLAKLALNFTADSVGLVATGDLSVNIPKMKSATSKVTYKGGGGRNEWNAEIHIKSEDIQLGSSVSVTGGFDGTIQKNELNFTGKISATFPGNNTAELGLKKSGTDWILFGGGRFNVPKRLSLGGAER